MPSDALMPLSSPSADPELVIESAAFTPQQKVIIKVIQTQLTTIPALNLSFFYPILVFDETGFLIGLWQDAFREVGEWWRYGNYFPGSLFEPYESEEERKTYHSDRLIKRQNCALDCIFKINAFYTGMFCLLIPFIFSTPALLLIYGNYYQAVLAITYCAVGLFCIVDAVIRTFKQFSTFYTDYPLKTEKILSSCFSNHQETFFIEKNAPFFREFAGKRYYNLAAFLSEEEIETNGTTINDAIVNLIATKLNPAFTKQLIFKSHFPLLLCLVYAVSSFILTPIFSCLTLPLLLFNLVNYLGYFITQPLKTYLTNQRVDYPLIEHQRFVMHLLQQINQQFLATDLNHSKRAKQLLDKLYFYYHGEVCRDKRRTALDQNTVYQESQSSDSTAAYQEESNVTLSHEGLIDYAARFFPAFALLKNKPAEQLPRYQAFIQQALSFFYVSNHIKSIEHRETLQQQASLIISQLLNNQPVAEQVATFNQLLSDPKTHATVDKQGKCFLLALTLLLGLTTLFCLALNFPLLLPSSVHSLAIYYLTHLELNTNLLAIFGLIGTTISSTSTYAFFSRNKPPLDEGLKLSQQASILSSSSQQP